MTFTFCHFQNGSIPYFDLVCSPMADGYKFSTSSSLRNDINILKIWGKVTVLCMLKPCLEQLTKQNHAYYQQGNAPKHILMYFDKRLQYFFILSV